MNHNQETDFKAVRRVSEGYIIYSLSDNNVVLRVPQKNAGASVCKIKDSKGDTIYKAVGNYVTGITITDSLKENVFLSWKESRFSPKTEVWHGSSCDGVPSFIVDYSRKHGTTTVSEAQSQETIASLSQEAVCSCFFSTTTLALHVDAGHNVPLLILLMMTILKRELCEKNVY